MTRPTFTASPFAVLIATVATVTGFTSPAPATAQEAEEDVPPMSFFLTSEGPGDGADLDGLEGADAHCRALAESVDAAGVEGLEWRAYLSALPTDVDPPVHARDRIGQGPWHNAHGVLIARDVADLHSEDVNLNKETALTESGEMVNGRGDSPNRHDILTGSSTDGMAFMVEGDDNCENWTSDGDGSARVGHHDRTGGGDNPTSWNSAHGTRGCDQEDLRGTGGDGLFYCFGMTPPDRGTSAPSRIPSTREED